MFMLFVQWCQRVCDHYHAHYLGQMCFYPRDESQIPVDMRCSMEHIQRLCIELDEQRTITLYHNPNAPKYHKRPVAWNDKIHKVRLRHQAKV